MHPVQEYLASESQSQVESQLVTQFFLRGLIPFHTAVNVLGSIKTHSCVTFISCIFEDHSCCGPL